MPSVVDMKGRLVSIEAATAITTEGATVSVLKLRQTLSDGRTAEEIIPETADPQADLDPQILLDAGSGDLLVIWSRHDGRRMTLAAARRDPSGSWSPITYLETGKDEPAAPRAAMGVDSRIHVVWKSSPPGSEPVLRYRAYDLTTLQALGDEIGPFDRESIRAKSAPGDRGPRPSGKPAAPSSRSAPGPSSAPPPAGRPAAFSAYGVEAGCDAAVVYRLAVRKLEVATLSGGKWSRGDVDLESAPDEAAARALVSDIARRFCRP